MIPTLAISPAVPDGPTILWPEQMEGTGGLLNFNWIG